MRILRTWIMNKSINSTNLILILMVGFEAAFSAYANEKKFVF